MLHEPSCNMRPQGRQLGYQPNCQGVPRQRTLRCRPLTNGVPTPFVLRCLLNQRTRTGAISRLTVRRQRSDRSQKSEDRSQKTGVRRQESEDRTQKTGVRRQESGDRRREGGEDRRQKTGVSFAALAPFCGQWNVRGRRLNGRRPRRRFAATILGWTLLT